MKTSIIIFALLAASLTLSAQLAEPDVVATKSGDLTIQPISHATLVMQLHDLTIYFDPHGDKELFKEVDKPDIIFITDIHGDHLNKETIKQLNTTKTTFVVPQAVADQLGDDYKDQVVIMNNGDQDTVESIIVTAIPMYNLPETEDSRHPKGRGNGYVLEIGDKKIYVSGDTEDIPEMRQLEKIDIAFVCMNLPYTMDIHQAASAVLDFKPALVYPYHYRGQGGLSDVEKFKELVNAENQDIKVMLKEWYPER